MRLYRRSIKVDLNDTIALCDFEADHGRVKLALERLRDLEEEIGENAKIYYAEGLIRRDFLGQGLASYRCFSRALELNPKHELSACNALQMAPDEMAFRRMFNEVRRLSFSEASVYQEVLKMLDVGQSYHDILLDIGQSGDDDMKQGVRAAILEIGLQESSRLDDTDVVRLRRLRAQSLRFLDLEAEQLRSVGGEDYPPSERLSLEQALAELDSALAVDDYDAELWNLRSAWCILLGLYDKAVEAADRAIALRPEGYPKPYHQKALALWESGRTPKAVEMVMRAMNEARATSSQRDLQMAEALCADIQRDPAGFEEVAMKHAATVLLETAERCADQVAERMHTQFEALCQAFVRRISVVSGAQSLEYVASVAQLLAYLPADAVAMVLRYVRNTDIPACQCCSEALCYIIANGAPVMQRDAARVAAFLVLDERSVDDMRHEFRVRFLALADASPSEYAFVPSLVNLELKSLNKHIPEFLTAKLSPTEPEIRDARDGVVIRLRGTPFVNDSGRSLIGMLFSLFRR